MKKKNSTTVPSVDVSFSAEHWEEFERGITYFNTGQYHHSYEAWELIWEQSDKFQRRFLRGLMDIATGCQILTHKRDIDSAISSFEKAYEKLEDEQYHPEFLGVPVKPLLTFIEEIKQKTKGNGSEIHDRMLKNLLPKILFHKPANPDLLVELCDIIHSREFLEGVNLFNKGYYWESHEVWEEVWREQIGEGKKFAEAFMQLAEAYNFTKQGKINPGIYLFEKSIMKLQEFEKVDCNLIFSSLLEDARNVLIRLHASAFDGSRTFKFTPPPEIKLVKK